MAALQRLECSYRNGVPGGLVSLGDGNLVEEGDEKNRRSRCVQCGCVVEPCQDVVDPVDDLGGRRVVCGCCPMMRPTLKKRIALSFRWRERSHRRCVDGMIDCFIKRNLHRKVILCGLQLLCIFS